MHERATNDEAPARAERIHGDAAFALSVERHAGRLIVALEAVTTLGASEMREARKHVDRLRFGLARVAQLRPAAASEGGAFAPARLGVAVSILETYVDLAANFVTHTVVRTRRVDAKDFRAAVEEANAAVDRALAA